jgi:adenylate cyclase, class 2
VIEVELKAAVRDVEALHAALRQRASAQVSTYADRYFDYPNHRLTAQGRELRVPTITDDCGQTRVLLTYKEPAPDADGVKREHETTAGDAEVVVNVPELAGQMFLELESMAETEEVDAAWDVVRRVLHELGISDHGLTTETYTGAVTAQRSH